MADIKEGSTLDEAMAARPDLFVAYQERLAVHEGDPNSKDKPIVKEGAETPELPVATAVAPTSTPTLTKDEVTRIVTEAVTQADGEVREADKREMAEGFKQRDMRTNADTLETLVAGSGLPTATKDRVRREFKDAYYDDKVTEADASDHEAVATTVYGTDRFRDSVEKYILDCHKELSEATGGRTHVTGTGPTSLSVEGEATVASHLLQDHDLFMSAFTGHKGKSAKPSSSTTPAPAAAGVTEEA